MLLTSTLLIHKRRTDQPYFFFFFNDTATTEIYTLSLHDALPILVGIDRNRLLQQLLCREIVLAGHAPRSEEHTSELQSLRHLVCRLLLEKKKETRRRPNPSTPLTESKIVRLWCPAALSSCFSPAS